MRGSKIQALALTLLLAACGGGGGGNPSLALTEANALDVAPVVIEMIGFSADLAGVLQDYWFLIEEQVPSGTYPCDGGGSFIATVDDRAPVGELSAGDHVTLEFFDCVPDASDPNLRIDGKFAFTVASAARALPAEEYVVQYSLTDLLVLGSGVELLYRGGLRATHSTTDQNLFTTILEISSLQSTLDVPGIGTFEQEISNATLRDEVDESNGDWWSQVEGDFYDSGVGGEVRIVTPVEFAGNGDDPPDTGVMELLGAGNSLERISSLGGGDVRIEVDENGDGTIDSTINTTWDDITFG